MRYRRLAVNSAVMFLAAVLLEMTLHEGGHFVAGLALHRAPVLHHNYVHFAEDDGSTLTAQIITAAAGPLWSFVLGVLAHLRLRAGVKNPFARLFLWQFAVAGYIGCLGYVLIAPVFPYGDTGFVFRALGVPMVVMIAMSIAAFFVTWRLMEWLGCYMVSLMSEATAADRKERGAFIYAVVLVALFIGIPLFTLLNLPAPTFLSLLAPLMSPWGVMYAYGEYLKLEPSADGFDSTERAAGKMPIGWFVLLAFVVAVNRLLVVGLG